MREDYLIKIKGVQEADGEENSVELMTRGSYVQRGGNYYISYRETEATGYAGCTTTVKLDRTGKVSMLRYGPMHSQLVIEKGRRHICHYDTGQGSITMGIAADEIVANLDERGGSLHFSYNLDINASLFSKNTVNITVREA